MVSTVNTRRGRGRRVGIALSQTMLCAAVTKTGESRPRAWRASVAPLNGEGGAWTALIDALRALARDSGITDGRLSVALLPPLAEARGLDLPPLGEREVQLLLARGASKYFSAARGAQVVGAVRGTRRPGAAAIPVVAAAASARIVNAIHDAARESGWTVDAVLPAEAAWGAAAAAWTGRTRGPVQLLVAHQDRTDLVRVEGSKLVGVRRFRGGAADAAIIVEANEGAGRTVSVVGQPNARRELAYALTGRGLTVESPASAVPEVAEEPDFLAAAFASPDVTPRLVTETERAADAENARRLTWRVVGAAAAIVVLAAVAELWGVKRELASVQAQRAALRPQLSTTLVGRTSVETAYQQLAALAAAERTAPEWSSVIAGVSERLPVEAYLTGFRGQGDSVTFDGLAAHAARVFEGLERVNGLVELRATAPVRHERPSDGPALERFSIGARVGTTPAPAGRGRARP
jgi:hypothetical protein